MRNRSRWLVVWIALKNLLTFIRIIPLPVAVNHFFETWIVKPSAGLIEKWQALSMFWRHFLTNLLVGLSISVGLIFLHGNPMLRDLENSGIDWAVRLYSGTSPSLINRPTVIFDIDEESYREWGEPVTTPRVNILKLIRLAVDGKAAVIVVDIDISQRYADVKADNALRDYFTETIACSRQDIQACTGKPLVVLMRTFHGQLLSEKNLLRQQRASFLDKVVAQSANMIWANPTFISEWDGVVRRWLLWEQTCNHNKPQILPSVQLVVATYLKDKDQDIHKLMSPLDALRSRTCKKPVATQINTAQLDEQLITLGKLKISSATNDLQQRILYRVPWIQKKGTASATIEFKGQDVPVFSKYSAHRLINAGQKIDRQLTVGRIVIIGSSTQDSRDIYQTPLGEMPGAVIIANAINSLLENGQFHPPSFWLKVLIEIILILVMTVCFTFFSSFWGMLVSGLSIVIVLIPLSLWFFGQGLWMDFAIPLLAVELHEMAAGFEKSLKQKLGQK